MSIVNAETINLLWKLLSREDYISVAGGLSHTSDSDAKNLLEFMLHVIHDHHFLNQDRTVNIGLRATQFMIKVMSEKPVIPTSLIVTGVMMPVKRNYIGRSGHIFRGELQGAAVALKELYMSENDVVSLIGHCYKTTVDVCANRPFVGKY